MYHYIYPAVFFHNEDEYQVFIPDLNLTTEGTTIDEAYLLAKDYLRAYCVYALKFGMEVEMPSPFDKIQAKYKDGGTVMLIDAIVAKEQKK